MSPIPLEELEKLLEDVTIQLHRLEGASGVLKLLIERAKTPTTT